MKAFISYSHADTAMLDLLHKHLAQLQREHIVTTWNDQAIKAGANLDNTISTALNSSNLFLALLSPDYIASNYCYEKEFATALEMEKKGEITIIPVIVESCDWKNTPFSTFKALPKDGKPVSTWDNKNTAFLDVIQNVRRLITSLAQIVFSGPASALKESGIARNYRVTKDFDSIEKIEFATKGFTEVKEYLKRYLEEIGTLDNIKFMIHSDSEQGFECILVNRNKVNTEANLTITTQADQSPFNRQTGAEKQIIFTINKDNRPSKKSFVVAFDDYHLYWSEVNNYSFSNESNEFGSKEIANSIWDELLECVGIGANN